MAKKENHTSQKNTADSLNWQRQWINFLFIFLILAITLGYLFWQLYQAREELSDEMGQAVTASSIPHVKKWIWLLPTPFILVLSVLCEAMSLSLLLRKNGYKRNVGQCSVYASADLYFSAITPSASGGQPASAYYMTKSGIPLYVSSSILVLNVSLYTLSLVIMSITALLCRPEFYAGFGPKSQLMVIFGVVFHFIFILICLAFMVSKRLVKVVGHIIIDILCKIHIMHDRKKKLADYDATIGQYESCFGIIRDHAPTVVLVLVLNVLQRFLMAAIPYFIFRAYDIPHLESFKSFTDVWILQMYSIVGSSGLPLPGAIGISEVLTEAMYETFIPGNKALSTMAMIMSRVIGSYAVIVGCGILTITYHIKHIGSITQKESVETDEQMTVFDESPEENDS